MRLAPIDTSQPSWGDMVLAAVLHAGVASSCACEERHRPASLTLLAYICNAKREGSSS